MAWARVRPFFRASVCSSVVRDNLRAAAAVQKYGTRAVAYGSGVLAEKTFFIHTHVVCRVITVITGAYISRCFSRIIIYYYYYYIMRLVFLQLSKNKNNI